MFIKEEKFDRRIIAALFIFCIGIDQLLKHFVLSNKWSYASKTFSIFPWPDESVMFGKLAELPLSINQYFLGMVTFYLIALLALVLFFLKNKDLFWLKTSFVMIVFSAVSSLIDRIRIKGVLKIFHLFPESSAGTSFAWDDVGLLSGLILMLVSVYLHWPEISGQDNQRKTFLIDKKYQLKIAGFISLCILGLGVSLSFFAYLYFKHFYLDLTLTGDNMIIETLLIGLFTITLIFGIICFFAIIIYTHRTVGPIYAFERFINDRFYGRKVELKLRKDDHLKQLEEIANKINIIIENAKQDEVPPVPPSN